MNRPIKITKDGDMYSAVLTPPHGNGAPWSTPHSMPLGDLAEALREHGCHPVDIAEAFLAANPSLLHEGSNLSAKARNRDNDLVKWLIVISLDDSEDEKRLRESLEAWKRGAKGRADWKRITASR
jgi:hypothetical protein